MEHKNTLWISHPLETLVSPYYINLSTESFQIEALNSGNIRVTLSVWAMIFLIASHILISLAVWGIMISKVVYTCSERADGYTCTVWGVTLLAQGLLTQLALKDR